MTEAPRDEGRGAKGEASPIEGPETGRGSGRATGPGATGGAGGLGQNSRDGTYRIREYRGRMGARFRSFSASYEDTDLWIGVDPGSYVSAMEDFAASMARSLRLELDAYIAARPEFFSSLRPIADDPGAPGIARAMIAASVEAGVGPMAAVAGAVAESVGSRLAAEFGCREAIVENGGDLWLLFKEPLDASVFAGASPLSERVGISIPATLSPLGLCTSSGTVGPSLSLGCADAAMVACRSVAVADAWATRIGNAVSRAEDIEAALDLIAGRAEIVSVILIKDEVMGIRGELPLKIFSRSKAIDQ